MIPESIPPAYVAWRTGTKYDNSICVTGRIDSLEPIPGLHKRLQIRAQHFLACFAGEGVEGGPGTRF